MARIVGGQIGAFIFHRLEGNLSPQIPILEKITEPWEDGEVYVELGRHAPEAVLTGWIDLPNAGDVPATKFLYSQVIGNIVEVQQRHGLDFAHYGNWKVMSVEDVTPEDKKWAAQAIGGINDGGIWLVTQWKLQYPLPF